MMAGNLNNGVSAKTADKRQSNGDIVKTRPRISDLLIITGHVYQIREWCERLDDVHVYETMGTVVAIFLPNSTGQRSSLNNEVVLVIKDKVRMGPTFKIIYPVFERPLPSLVEVGTTVRVIGKLINKYSMRAMKITCPASLDIVNFDRITHVCFNRIQKYFVDIAEP